MTDQIGFIGDSIALGTAWEFGYGTHTGTEIQQPNCRCKVGASGNTIAGWPVPQTPVLVVSMGSNPTFDLQAMLAKVRDDAAPDAQVTFILPARLPEREAVADFAAQHGCSTVSFTAGQDGVHPLSYVSLATAIRGSVANSSADSRKPLFDAIRAPIFHGLLTQPQVEGIGRILDFAEQRRTPIHQLAYICATATWETGRAMRPVEEAFNLPQPQRTAYLKSKPYYPYYGRGLVQVTWQANYVKFGITAANDLLTWPVALRALFDGMGKGMFTGRKLSDYVSADGMKCDYVNARRVVNGVDRAGEIAGMAKTWFAGLHACGYGVTWPATQAVPGIPGATQTAAPQAATTSLRNAQISPPPLSLTVGQRLAGWFFKRKDAA